MSASDRSASLPARRIWRETSVRQLELMVNFLERHRDLALGRLKNKETRVLADRLWEECAQTLNATDGPTRTSKDWRKKWSELKMKVREKVRENAEKAVGGKEGDCEELTAIEERVAAIIRGDVEFPISVAQQNQYHDQSLHSSVDGVLSDSHNPLTHNIKNETIDSILDDTTSSQTEDEQSLRELSRDMSVSNRKHRRRIQKSRNNSSQSSINALEETLALISKIEEAKAKAEEKRAEADLKQAEALMVMAQAQQQMANALSLIASTLSESRREQALQNHSSIV